MATPSSTLRPGLALESGQYEAEANTYLRKRLRVFYGLIVGFAVVIYAVGAFLFGNVLGWGWGLIFNLDRLIHLGALAVAFAIFVQLRRRAFSGRTLLLLDAAGLYIAVGTSMMIYVVIFEMGPSSVPAIIGMFVIARAVIVPCEAKTTFLLSLPAPIGILVIELAFGTIYVEPGVQHSPEIYPLRVVWNQVAMWIALAISVVAAHVNFGLRRQALKARELGQYKLEQKLGEGAMGEVYRATHAMLRRPTAIKLLRPEITGEETLRRFEREVRQTARLTHPNIVSIYDYGRTPDGIFYYAMEFLKGEDLQTIVDRFGPMPASRVIHVLDDACAGLEEAHAQGLVHRDIKPGNLVLCAYAGGQDVLKLVDFGLVKVRDEQGTGLTQVGEFCGTPETIAPEALSGQPVTPQSDLYALAAVGCFLLTGKPIFNAATVTEFVGHHLHSAPIPPRERNSEVPADLEAVLMRCLAKDPAARPNGVHELRAELARCADAGGWTQELAAAWWGSI